MKELGHSQKSKHTAREGPKSQTSSSIDQGIRSPAYARLDQQPCIYRGPIRFLELRSLRSPVLCLQRLHGNTQDLLLLSHPCKSFDQHISKRQTSCNSSDLPHLTQDVAVFSSFRFPSAAPTASRKASPSGRLCGSQIYATRGNCFVRGNLFLTVSSCIYSCKARRGVVPKDFRFCDLGEFLCDLEHAHNPPKTAYCQT